MNVTVAVVYSILWLLASWKWANWRNWREYYPTALYAAFGAVLYEFICYSYILWQMEPNGLPNGTLPALLLILIGMPVSTIIFLSQYPGGKPIGKRIAYNGLFVVIYVILEYVAVVLGSITYHHGWNLLWSTLFVIVMFPILRIHQRNPLRALLLSACFIFFLAFVFELTFDKMK